MAVAPETIEHTLNLTDRDTLARLNSEGRVPLVSLRNLGISDNAAYSPSTEAQVLIPGTSSEPEQKINISTQTAKEIAEIQRELLLQ